MRMVLVMISEYCTVVVDNSNFVVNTSNLVVVLFPL